MIVKATMMEDLLKAEKEGGNSAAKKKRDSSSGHGGGGGAGKGGSFRSLGTAGSKSSGTANSLIGFFVGEHEQEEEEEACGTTSPGTLSPDVMSPASSGRYLMGGNGNGVEVKNKGDVRFSSSSSSGAAPTRSTPRASSSSSNLDKFDVVADILSASERNRNNNNNGHAVAAVTTTAPAQQRSSRAVPPRASSNLAKFDDIFSSSERGPMVGGGGTTEPLSTRRDMMLGGKSKSYHLPKRRSKEDLAMGANAKISRVENSWYAISSKIGEVGLKFFLRMFDEHPDLVHLFPFGDDSIDSNTGKLKVNEKTKAHIRAHAIAVMRVVGTCVAGLTKIEDLIPRLRTVGATHKTVGVQPIHYDILYKHLVRAIREEVGSENWDQETEDAWEQAFISISDMIKRPSKRLETEPLTGWGILMLLACTYFMIMTPFRFAGFLYGNKKAVIVFNICDGIGALIMAIDMVINIVQTKLRVGHITNILEEEEIKERNSLQIQFQIDFPDETTIPSDAVLKQFYNNAKTKNHLGRIKSIKKSILFYYYRRRVVLYRKIQALKMDRWVPWPALDARVLISFPLQYCFMPTSICGQIGLHWTQLFGFLRVLTVSRFWHFMQCAENNALIEQKLDTNRQVQIRVIRLLLVLAFIIHISACTWCTVARVQLGHNAKEFEPTPFFPSSDILDGGNSNVFRSYSRAVHWAFVNLSGIGDVDSSPETGLECWITLIIHVIGAVFYAIVTGNVIAILEEQTKHQNKMGSDIVKLSEYLETARVSEFSKDRIMKGYMMRNVLTHQGGRDGQRRDGGVGGITNEGPDLNDEILATLPNYLRQEVGIYARAELIHRKDKFFSHCSKGFLVSLSSSLNHTRTLLTGDYLMHEGQLYRNQFVLIESGSLQIQQENHTIKFLGKGDCIGKAWLLQLLSKDPKNNKELCEKTDYVRGDGKALVTIRALTPCTLLTGLFNVRDIQKLEHGYKVDFQLLHSEMRGSTRSEAENNAIARQVLARAARRYIQRKRNNKTQWRKAYHATTLVHDLTRKEEKNQNVATTTTTASTTTIKSHHQQRNRDNVKSDLYVDDDEKNEKEPNCFGGGCVLM